VPKFYDVRVRSRGVSVRYLAIDQILEYHTGTAGNADRIGVEHEGRPLPATLARRTEAEKPQQKDRGQDLLKRSANSRAL